MCSRAHYKCLQGLTGGSGGPSRAAPAPLADRPYATFLWRQLARCRDGWRVQPYQVKRNAPRSREGVENGEHIKKLFVVLKPGSLATECAHLIQSSMICRFEIMACS